MGGGAHHGTATDAAGARGTGLSRFSGAFSIVLLVERFAGRSPTWSGISPARMTAPAPATAALFLRAGALPDALPAKASRHVPDAAQRLRRLARHGGGARLYLGKQPSE